MLNTLNSLFWYTKVFSNPHHAVIDHYRTAKKSRILYSIVTKIALMSFEVFSTLEYLTSNNFGDSKSIMLKILQTILNWSCLIADVTIGLDWNNRFPLILNHLRSYDTATNFPRKTYDLKLNQFRATIIIVFIHWVVIVYLRHQMDHSYFNSFHHCLYIEYYMQPLTFCGLLLSVYQRFDHLNQLILTEDEMENKIGMTSHTLNSVGLQKAWWLHWNLSRALEIINKIWNIQLFVWMSKLFLITIFKVYKFLDQSDKISTLYEGLGATTAFFHLCMIITSCHLASKQANKVAQNIFSPLKILHKKEENVSQSNVMANAYFGTKKIHFTAGNGLIQIRLTLLISIMGAMTTYLVVLSKAPSPK